MQRGPIATSGEKEIAQKITQIACALSADSFRSIFQDLSVIQNEIVKLAPLNKENLQQMRQNYERAYGHLSFQQLERLKLPLVPDYMEGDTAFVDLKQCHDARIHKNTSLMKKSGLIGGVISLLCFVDTSREDFDAIKEEKNAIVAAINAGLSRLQLEEKNSDLRELNQAIVGLCKKSIDIAEQEIKKRDQNTFRQPGYSLVPRVSLLPPPMPSFSSSSSSVMPRPIPVRPGR